MDHLVESLQRLTGIGLQSDDTGAGEPWRSERAKAIYGGERAGDRPDDLADEGTPAARADRTGEPELHAKSADRRSAPCSSC